MVGKIFLKKNKQHALYSTNVRSNTKRNLQSSNEPITHVFHESIIVVSRNSAIETNRNDCPSFEFVICFLYFRDGRVTSIIGENVWERCPWKKKRKLPMYAWHGSIKKSFLFHQPLANRFQLKIRQHRRNKRQYDGERLMTINEINEALTVFLRKINNLQSSVWDLLIESSINQCESNSRISLYFTIDSF